MVQTGDPNLEHNRDPQPTAKLTGKQRAFVDAYFATGFNGTEAAARSGYSGDRTTLAEMASENLRKPHIRAAIDARMAERAMSADEVLARLGDIARGSLNYFVDENGEVDLVQARENGKLHLAKRVSQSVSPTGAVSSSVDLHDPLTALTLLAKHHRLTVDRTEVSGPEGGPIINRIEIVASDRRDASEEEADG